MLDNLNFNFQILLDAIGLVQGVTLGILLMFMNKRKYKSTFFLGIFLFLYALELGTWISVNTKVSDSIPSLYLLPFNFSWLLFPLFYIYTQQVSVLSNDKTKYWLLYPGIVSFLAQVIIFSFPFETKQVIEDSTLHVLVFWILGNYYSWFIGIWNLKLLYRHSIEVQNTYSYIASKELRWARFFLIYLLGNSIFSHIIAYGFPTLIEDNTIFSVLDLIAIYWVSYFGVMQSNVRSVIAKNWGPDNSQDMKKNQNYMPESALERLENLMGKIDNHMVISEIFINPELTIMDLAEGIKEHPKLVSAVINTINKQNFNSYVNQLRIKKAEILLTNQTSGYFSIEGIGKEVGFHSKSAFYAAFKKVTGTTPKDYKKKQVS